MCFAEKKIQFPPYTTGTGSALHRTCRSWCVGSPHLHLTTLTPPPSRRREKMKETPRILLQTTAHDLINHLDNKKLIAALDFIVNLLEEDAPSPGRPQR